MVYLLLFQVSQTSRKHQSVSLSLLPDLPFQIFITPVWHNILNDKQPLSQMD